MVEINTAEVLNEDQSIFTGFTFVFTLPNSP